MSVLGAGEIRYGRVSGRYFRENFAQGGLDLAQVIAELVTNADAAISATGRPFGRIVLRLGPPEFLLVRRWRRELERLGAPALLDWQHEASCTDDGEGVDAEIVERRLGTLGVLPERLGQRGLFGRGLRDVWLAQGGGRIQGVRGDRAVETWFFPAAGEEPYAFAHVLDEPVTPALRAAFGIDGNGTRVTVPLADRLPPSSRLRDLATNLVQLRPVLEDPGREVYLDLPGEALQLVTRGQPEPDPARPLLADETVELAGGHGARIVVRRAAEPIALGPSRATRRGGLVVRSGRAAHEATLAGLETRPGARHLYGEVWCEAIETLQREALEAPRPQVVVRVDRTGLNESHPLVRSLQAAIERIVRPIVEAEERRAGAHLVTAGRAVRARDEVGLRALNDALRAAFDAPGTAGFARGGEGDSAPRDEPAREEPGLPRAPREPASAVAIAGPMRFKGSPLRLHPGEQRTVSLLFDPLRLPPGSRVEVSADPGLRLALSSDAVPEPGRLGWSRLRGALRASASVDPGALLSVLATSGEHAAELEVLIARHHASGWVREIARKDDDAEVEAEFDAESGIVTVHEGRREFKALERAARQGGLPRKRVAEYLPYRLLEVEVAANAVYAWAAEQIVRRRAAESRLGDPAEYAGAVRLEAQRLRHRFHERLMRAFLDPEVFDGTASAPRAAPAPTQERLRLE